MLYLIAIFTTILFLSSFIINCGSVKKDDTLFIENNNKLKSKKTIKVSIFHSPPDCFVDKENNPKGIFVDLLNVIAKYENWEMVYVMDDWNTGLKKLESGEVDLKVSIAYTKERDIIFDYSKEPIYLDWAEVITDKFVIYNIFDLNNKKVGLTENGYFPEEFKSLCLKFAVSPEFVYYKSDEEILSALSNNSIDAGVVPHLYAMLNYKKYDIKRSPIIFSPVGVYIASPKGKNLDILKAIDDYLKLWKKDNHSIYYEIVDNWFTNGRNILKLPKWFFTGTVITALIFIILMIWIRMLKYQVEKRVNDYNRSEKKFRLIFENSVDAIGVSISGKHILVNNSGSKFIYGK